MAEISLCSSHRIPVTISLPLSWPSAGSAIASNATLAAVRALYTPCSVGHRASPRPSPYSVTTQRQNLSHSTAHSCNLAALVPAPTLAARMSRALPRQYSSASIHFNTFVDKPKQPGRKEGKEAGCAALMNPGPRLLYFPHPRLTVTVMGDSMFSRQVLARRCGGARKESKEKQIGGQKRTRSKGDE